MDSIPGNDEVMAQRFGAAFDAMREVLAVIDRRRDDLNGTPGTRGLIERADRIAWRFGVGPADQEQRESA